MAAEVKGQASLYFYCFMQLSDLFPSYYVESEIRAARGALTVKAERVQLWEMKLGKKRKQKFYKGGKASKTSGAVATTMVESRHFSAA